MRDKPQTTKYTDAEYIRAMIAPVTDYSPDMAQELQHHNERLKSIANRLEKLDG